jgi:DNA anti-recombination protein RmuC
MINKIKIGISQRVDWIKTHNEYRDSVDHRLTEWVLSCGFMPVLVPNTLVDIELSLDAIKRALNARLPVEIRIIDIVEVDSKFHSRLIDKYETYIEVAEKGEEGSGQVDAVRKEILDSIKSDAEDISSKYMQEGVTVDVGIMFIMSESLNQLIDTPDFRKRNKNIGIREEIFNEHRVLIMGPNSFAAYLTSIYMGFKTLSLNDQAREIVKDIGKAKKEFNKFSNSTRLLIRQAESMLNKAREQETRERAMSKVLDSIEEQDDEVRDT